MEFKTYLDSIGLKPYQFAKTRDLPSVLVWRAYNGERVSPDNATLIASKCFKKVKVLDLLYPTKTGQGEAAAAIK